VVAAIHLIEAPDQFNDATYKGLLFLVDAVGAGVAAVAILRGVRWGWSLGVLMAGGALVAYVVSRTVGLPGLPADPDWFEPMGVLSVLAEALYLVVAFTMARPEVAGPLQQRRAA
jgi:hypothetical protein